jgi:cobalamin biosynthetic protein CobC
MTDDHDPPEHGGRLEAARRRWPGAPSPWIDLSTGISPYAFPFARPPMEAWTRLPEPEDVVALETAAAGAYGAPRGTRVVAAAGSQPLLSALTRCLPAGRVGILGFTYAEHERSWRVAGAAVTIVDMVETLGGFDVAVVVNPNNPDGRILEPSVLRDLAARLAETGGRLIVDEAFMDVADAGLSLVPLLPANAVVLRSFGKAFGLAGLRLGFAIAPDATGRALARDLGPWPVSGPAIAIGRQALSSSDWLARTILVLDRDVAELDRLLASQGWPVAGGTRLFRLAEVADAAATADRLAAQGVLVRAFPARPGWLRFGVPSSQQRRLFESRLASVAKAQR